MLLVAVNGSPQKKGNTVTLLRHGLQAAAALGVEARLLHVSDALAGLKVPFCYQCSEPCQGRCSRDNALGEALNLLRRADGLLVGSPVYFGSISGQLKAFWDKTRILRREQALLNVAGGAVVVGSSRFGGQEAVLLNIYQMMLVHGMTVIGDGYWEDTCGHLGAAAQKPAAEDQQALERVEVVTRRLIQVAEACVPLRQREDGDAGGHAPLWD